MQGYPLQPWPQPLSSQNESVPDIGGGEAQGHACPTQYNPQMYSPGPYEGQVGADAGGNGDYKWTQQQYVPATEGEGSAGTIPALGAVSMNRATDNNHEYFHSHAALTGSQVQRFSLDYTRPQVSGASAPIVAPQPGTANIGSYIPYSDQNVADVSAYGGWAYGGSDSYGASPLEVSEATGSGYVINLNESKFSASSAAAGEHTGQQQFPGYTHRVQALEYVEQSGTGVMPGSAQKHELAPLQQQYGQATRLVGLPASSGTKDYILHLHGGQSYPSVHWKLGPGTHAGLDALSLSGPRHHWWPEVPLYPLLDATGVTWMPSHPQIIPATVANATDNSMAGAPAGSAGAADPNPSEYNIPRRPMGGTRMSTTRTGRKGPRRGAKGQMFEESLEKVQERLRKEGAEVGAVECLGSEIFVDGKITKAALKAEMTQEQREARRGKQKYMLLLDVVEYPQGSNEERNHRCLLCRPAARVEYKNREDSLRHIYKDHFGLSFDCEFCTGKFWHKRELNKHVKAVHKAKDKDKDKARESPEALD